ncbi:MAG: glycoside hydrolase family 3 protein [Bacilli bacterium]|nr:glycoside hydrolase family 3 protein [Bacilli bacterium]MBN2876899.1 glycoside hydrolase family 3 protein [Bacilli bacterium]
MKKHLLLVVMVIISMAMISCTQSSTTLEETTTLNTTVDYTSMTTLTSTLMTSSEVLTESDFIETLLSQMTMQQKAAQMLQAERAAITPEQVQDLGIGSILSGGGSHPNAYDDDTDTWYQMVYDYQAAALSSTAGIPILYGIDAVHGNNNLYGATIFPHNIGLGMANDADLVYDISKATAEEMLTTGITWTFAPALSVVQDVRWGRTYEGYSENPEIHEHLTQSAILGFEENGVSATAKHFFGDGGTTDGIDQGNTMGTESDLRALFLAPYYDAIEAGVDTIMVSYNSINGIKMHGFGYWVSDVLKDEMGFEGFVVSDWNGIHQLSGDYKNQIVSAINAGVDMLMEPYDFATAIDLIVEAVNDQLIPIARIDDAVGRILKVKYEQGLFDHPYVRLSDSYLYNQDHKDLARQAVRESLVLLKNENNSLPLAKDGSIFLTGPGADNIGYMCGGWTTYWQGNTSADIGVGESIKDSFTRILSASGESLATSWESADTVVVVLSELPYSEGVGDNTNMTLTGGNASPENAAALQVAQSAKAADKNVVGILISGRPLLLENYLDSFDSFVAAWLPGSEGGDGISDVLFGDYDFTGTLSYTWPASYGQIGITSVDFAYDPDLTMFPYGYGLRYS